MQCYGTICVCIHILLLHGGTVRFPQTNHQNKYIFKKNKDKVWKTKTNKKKRLKNDTY